MSKEEEVLGLARLCSKIADKAADENGFVAIRDLLAHFQARIVSRPLLVEGMLGSVPNGDGRSWVVLLDSDRYPLSEKDLSAETQQRTLAPRLRNTIAHELVHSLAFRQEEFGFKFAKKFPTPAEGKRLIDAIEEETESLSPFLLLPDKAIVNLLKSAGNQLQIQDLVDFCALFGASRYVTVSRLCQLRRIDPMDLLMEPAIRNCAIGVGFVNEDGTKVLRPRPLFSNFDREIGPRFLSRLRFREPIKPAEIFHDQKFWLLGGNQTETTQTVEFGLGDRSNAGEGKVRCTVEAVTSRKRSFLFMVRRL